MVEPYFTTKVATETTFCNREQESQLLRDNIQKNQHTVVVAPRRYGKTSLIIHALNLQEPLNSNRLKVLITIAQLGAINEPNSKVFLDTVKLALASTQNAVKYLMNNDYLYETKEGLKLVDPLMKKFLVEQHR